MACERIQKVIARSLKISRRKADSLVVDGLVQVNGNVAKVGQQVDCGKDSIRVEGTVLKFKKEPSVVFMVNKPVGYVCSNNDPYNPLTVIQLLPHSQQSKKWMHVGRLDKDSQGLTILTNDGELAQKIMHPSFEVSKRYKVELNDSFSEELQKKLLNGVLDDGEKLFVDFIKATTASNKKFEIHLHQGRKREIRRMFEKLGFKVKRLVRYQVGGLKMPASLKPGMVSKLSLEEIRLIFQKNR